MSDQIKALSDEERAEDVEMVSVPCPQRFVHWTALDILRWNATVEALKKENKGLKLCVGAQGVEYRKLLRYISDLKADLDAENGGEVLYEGRKYCSPLQDLNLPHYKPPKEIED